MSEVFAGGEDVDFSVLTLFTQPNIPDQSRHHVFGVSVAEGRPPAGYATEDGVGLHYVGTELREAVTMVDGARAWRVEPSPPGGYHIEAITPRRL